MQASLGLSAIFNTTLNKILGDPVGIQLIYKQIEEDTSCNIPK